MTTTTTKDPNRCDHTFHRVWCPCPFGCHEAEYAAVRGIATTPEEIAHVAVIGEAQRGQHLKAQNEKRRLKLEGETLAGCEVGHAAADGDYNTRFHTKMACGHMAIVSGTHLKAQHKKGKTLFCKACTKQRRVEQIRAKSVVT